MKIGILTLPLHMNYGGILQAWALQTVLEHRGYKVEILGKKATNHSAISWPFVWMVRFLRKIKGCRDIKVFYEVYESRRKTRVCSKINRFIKSRIHTRFIKGLESIPAKSYDAIVVGSDQIWRKPYINQLWQTQDVSLAWLAALPEDNLKRIAYAASLGIGHWDFSESETAQIKEAIRKFNAISVRETSATDILSTHIGCKADFVLDPTMLLRPEEYSELLSINSKNSTDTVVSYILDPSEFSGKLITEVVSSKRLRHKELNMLPDGSVLISVEEWVESIANARMVVTDSFHGCIFSLIFGKPLIFMYNESRGNARFDSLIATFKLGGNCISDLAQYNSKKSYDLPAETCSIINDLRDKSMGFLKNAL